MTVFNGVGRFSDEGLCSYVYIRAQLWSCVEVQGRMITQYGLPGKNDEAAVQFNHDVMIS